jgi:hypothetical protein
MGDLSPLEVGWLDFQDAADDAMAALGPIIAAIAEEILSLFPGIGSALSVALATGIALARGRPIEEVIVDAAAGAIPGGAVGAFGFKQAVYIGGKIARGETLEQATTETVRANLTAYDPSGVARTAFDASINLIHGNDIGDAALAAIRSRLPAGVMQTAFDTTVRVARGEPVDQAAIDLVRANLPPAYRSAFDTSVAIARGAPLTGAALEAARMTAEQQGPSALAAFDVSIPLARGVTIDPAVLNAVRSRIPAPDLPSFDQTVAIAHASGLQNSGYTEATTFMRWAPAAWDTAYTGYDPHSHRLADLLSMFGDAAELAQARGMPALQLLERYLLDDLATLDPVQWGYWPAMVAHLEKYRNNFEHDLQDNPPDVLAQMFTNDQSGGGVVPFGQPPVTDAITRAALASVPFVEKPPYDSRKAKERGQQDILDAYARATPNAMHRRSRIFSALDLFKYIDSLLMGGAAVDAVFNWARSNGSQFGGEAGQLTIDQVFSRIHQLAAKGLAQDDFPEWHLSPQTPTVQFTWDTEAAFLAAPTLPTAAEYRRRAKLETELAARILEGPTDPKARDLTAKAAADLVKAQALDIVEFGQAVETLAKSGAKMQTPAQAAAATADFWAKAAAKAEAATAQQYAQGAAVAAANAAAVARQRKIKLFVLGGGVAALLAAVLLVEGTKS